MTVFLMLFVICFFIFGLAVGFVLFKLVQGYDELVDRIGVLETRTSEIKARVLEMVELDRKISREITRLEQAVRSTKIGYLEKEAKQ